MLGIPHNTQIYHITHINNLERIIKKGQIWSDAWRIEKGLECDLIGMSRIKERRLNEIEVSCRPGTMVGEYVPFYFCPRSIMLYILYRKNHPDITYNQGQDEIIHIVADLEKVICYCDQKKISWAFSDVNAGAKYVRFFNDLREMEVLDWNAINSRVWINPKIKEGKQAEFLVKNFFAFELTSLIGVMNSEIQKRVDNILSDRKIELPVKVKRNWYY